MSCLYGLTKRGHTARCENGKLVVTPPMEPGLKAQVVEHRDEILLELARTTNAPRATCRWCGAAVHLVPYPNGDGWHWTLCEVCEEPGTHYVLPPYVLIESKLVGGTFALGEQCPRDYVGYTPAEMRHIVGLPEAMLQAIHKVKRKFPGAVVDAEDSVWMGFAKQEAA